MNRYGVKKSCQTSDLGYFRETDATTERNEKMFYWSNESLRVLYTREYEDSEEMESRR